MNRENSITRLTSLINVISMAGPHETIPLASCEHIARAMHTSGWLRQVKAEAWDEGLTDGINHDLGDWENAPSIITNPYRQEQEA